MASFEAAKLELRLMAATMSGGAAGAGDAAAFSSLLALADFGGTVESGKSVREPYRAARRVAVAPCGRATSRAST